ncbi:MAG: IMP dehydrogenase [Thaumarchaeota archaeon]|nr:MAG: IMP dehydrogenase [Nitrososphaerota archaeon]
MRVSPQEFRTGLTYDDVLLVPKYSEIKSRKDVSTTTRFSRNISMSISIVSANMDTGVIHRFLSVADQVAEVSKVKRSEGIVIEDPITLLPDRTIGEALDVIRKHDIGGIVVIDSGRRVAGLVTVRDIHLEEDLSVKISEVMTPLGNLITAQKGVTMEQAKELLRKNKIEKLPILEKDGRLAGLITSKDIVKRRRFPMATKDAKGRLRVAAAIGVKGDYMERAEKLLEVDVDALVVDIAHGHSAHAIDTLKEIRRRLGQVEVVAGNVATSSGTRDLIKAGADAVKVGVGSGSICITRIVTGVGVPQLTAIIDSANAAAEDDIPVIADGGVRNPGDVTKALAAGATTVMIGSLFAGTEESPGPTILREGVRYKLTRGMASLEATIDRKVRDSDGSSSKNGLVEEAVEESVPEGVEGLIPYKGKVEEVVRQLVGGLRSGMSYCGAKTIPELQTGAEFLRMSEAGLKESRPHDIEKVV